MGQWFKEAFESAKEIVVVGSLGKKEPIVGKLFHMYWLEKGQMRSADFIIRKYPCSDYPEDSQIAILAKDKNDDFTFGNFWDDFNEADVIETGGLRTEHYGYLFGSKTALEEYKQKDENIECAWPTCDKLDAIYAGGKPYTLRIGDYDFEGRAVTLENVVVDNGHYDNFGGINHQNAFLFKFPAHGHAWGIMVCLDNDWQDGNSRLSFERNDIIFYGGIFDNHFINGKCIGCFDVPQEIEKIIKTQKGRIEHIENSIRKWNIALNDYRNNLKRIIL